MLYDVKQICMNEIYLIHLRFIFELIAPERGKSVPCSGPRSSKRVPVEDLGNNRHPSPCMS